MGRRGKIATVLQQHLQQVSRRGSFKVLDIGAYDRAFGRALEAECCPCIYHSLDIDDSRPHDFHRLDEVNGTYDIIAMFELIEHLPYESVNELLATAYHHLAPDGRMFISTPNPFHPTRYFSDVSHKQHWPPGDLFALLRHVGFVENSIEMYGVVYKGFFSASNAPRLCVDWFRNVIWRVIGLETRGGILAVATKAGPESEARGHA